MFVMCHFTIAFSMLLIQQITCFVPHYSSSLNPSKLESQKSSDIQASEFLSTHPVSSVPQSSLDILTANEAERRNVYDPGDIEINDLENYDDPFNDVQSPMNMVEIIHKLEDDIRNDQEIADKSAILMKMLEDPNFSTLPVVYVEEPEEVDEEENEERDFLSPINSLQKRSRYYRKYPGKRHNRNRSSSSYEPDLRYLCVPSREDVFKLLIGIHENRKGNHNKVINFCNRKRPAKLIFTNIRFLG